MRVLITGAAGYLGRRICARALARRHSLVAVHRGLPPMGLAGELAAVDITDEDRLVRALHLSRPDAVIHAAALNPGQGSASEMERVNHAGSRNVARAAAEVGGHMVHVSTDMVHGGGAAPYADDAESAPINAYGRSKAAAERAVLEELPGAAIVRTSLIYGLHEMDRGTAGFAGRLARGEPLALFADVLRQPVWVETLAEALVGLAERGTGGRFNVAGEQVLSREGFGRRMLAWWGVPGCERITAGTGAEVSDEIPLDLRLELDRARRVLGIELPGVDPILARFPSPSP